jgi:hypothetical protein
MLGGWAASKALRLATFCSHVPSSMNFFLASGEGPQAHVLAPTASSVKMQIRVVTDGLARICLSSELEFTLVNEGNAKMF